MNDFLHNLRSKNKRYDGNRRQFPSSQYQDRRNGKDNRKPNHAVNAAVEQLSTTLSENLPLIKSLLEGISENQKHLAIAEERRAGAEERKAAVMETIVEIAKQWIDGNLNLPDLSKINFSKASEVETKKNDHEVSATEDDSSIHLEKPEKTTATGGSHAPEELSREEVLDIIRKMRGDGATYELIARHLDSRGIPTFSRKGKWRGQTIHRLYQKLTEKI